jgi:hypothetical protein
LPTPSREQLVDYAKQGAQLLARGGDFGAVLNMLRDYGNEFAELSKSGAIA